MQAHVEGAAEAQEATAPAAAPTRCSLLANIVGAMLPGQPSKKWGARRRCPPSIMGAAASMSHLCRGIRRFERAGQASEAQEIGQTQR